MHEILTLQLGHRANYVATHFWNTQESYFTYDSSQELSPVDHDVHFRPGIGAHGEETFTPRTLIYDLKGGFGGMRKWGGLYDQQQLGDVQPVEQASGVWDGSIAVHTDPQIPQSEYQRGLDEDSSTPTNLTTETVRYWSDFNRVFYHPRSVVQINDYELSSSLTPFEKWECGEELFVKMDRDADLLDRDVRAWAEECDHLQGLQVFTSGDDAWGGFASRPDAQKRGLLGDLEAVMNVNGNQRIVQLDCSIRDPKNETSRSIDRHASRDHRAPSSRDYTMVEEDKPETTRSQLDIDLSGGDVRPFSSTVGQHHTSDHIFGAVEMIRGGDGLAQEEDGDEDDVIDTRKRRRLAGLAVVESRVKSLQKLVSKMANIDEREALSNGLGEIGEAYEEGWDGESDEDSDD
ncbi:hypothetical protein P7C71_g1441, partial [Lecanoromycetidae sp. Uapishka_2]